HTNHLNRLSTAGPLANPARLIESSASKLPALIHRLSAAMAQSQSSSAKTLDSLALRLAKHQPAAVHATRREHIAGLTKLLHNAIHTRIDRLDAQLSASQRELNAIGPRQVLARGFSVTTAADGRLVRSTKDLKTGDQLTTHLKDGQVQSTVSGESTKSKPASKSKQSKDQPPEPNLFGDLNQ
ncbi:MAG: exodeoxyribonuclease VII large subunit, partial [Phycisphaerales bacterium]|nr:exodeoxyribonuclease VII large subunit [Phycisphaerales bacterium]